LGILGLGLEIVGLLGESIRFAIYPLVNSTSYR
jgi:hypothetical protein